jgi:hypothetical protein
MSLMNTHRRDPRADDDAADEEDDVEEDEDERDEAVTGGAASSPCVPPVPSGAGPRSGAGTSALISLSRGDALRSGDMDRARRCTDALRGVRSRPRVGAARPPQSSSSLPGSRSGSGGRVSGRIWPLWKSSSAEIMGPPGPPNSNSASPAHPRPPPAPGVAEAEHEAERRRWWMGLAGALKK